MPHATLIKLPGIEIFRWLAARALSFHLAEFGLQSRNQGLVDFVWKREDVGKVAVVALGPNMVAGGGID